MLSVQPTERKICARTANGKQIADELIDVLAGKAEAGYEIEELAEIREDVHRIAAAHGSTNVRLLGSAGRGKQNASSSLGLLVDMAGRGWR